MLKTCCKLQVSYCCRNACKPRIASGYTAALLALPFRCNSHFFGSGQVNIWVWFWLRHFFSTQYCLQEAKDAQHLGHPIMADQLLGTSKHIEVLDILLTFHFHLFHPNSTKNISPPLVYLSSTDSSKLFDDHAFSSLLTILNVLLNIEIFPVQQLVLHLQGPSSHHHISHLIACSPPIE